LSIVIPGAGPNGRDLRRSYSIASPPGQNPVELCVRWVEEGPGSSFLFKLREGDVFRGFGPYGHFIFKTKADRHTCFIATGTGIAPFRAMFMSPGFEERRPLSLTCLLGIRSEAEMLYEEDFKTLDFVKLVVCTSRPERADFAGYRGRVTDYLKTEKHDFPWDKTDFYLCGNGSMIDEVKQFLRMDKELPRECIHQEIYFRPPQE
jgi:NAD(P)H-flavin reductase